MFLWDWFCSLGSAFLALGRLAVDELGVPDDAAWVVAIALGQGILSCVVAFADAASARRLTIWRRANEEVRAQGLDPDVDPDAFVARSAELQREWGVGPWIPFTAIAVVVTTSTISASLFWSVCEAGWGRGHGLVSDADAKNLASSPMWDGYLSTSPFLTWGSKLSLVCIAVLVALCLEVFLTGRREGADPDHTGSWTRWAFVPLPLVLGFLPVAALVSTVVLTLVRWPIKRRLRPQPGGRHRSVSAAH